MSWFCDLPLWRQICRHTVRMVETEFLHLFFLIYFLYLEKKKSFLCSYIPFQLFSFLWSLETEFWRAPSIITLLGSGKHQWSRLLYSRNWKPQSEGWAQCIYITSIIVQGSKMSDSYTTVGREHQDPEYPQKMQGLSGSLKNGDCLERQKKRNS